MARLWDPSAILKHFGGVLLLFLVWETPQCLPSKSEESASPDSNWCGCLQQFRRCRKAIYSPVWFRMIAPRNGLFDIVRFCLILHMTSQLRIHLYPTFERCPWGVSAQSLEIIWEWDIHWLGHVRSLALVVCWCDGMDVHLQNLSIPLEPCQQLNTIELQTERRVVFLVFSLSVNAPSHSWNPKGCRWRRIDASEYCRGHWAIHQLPGIGTKPKIAAQVQDTPQDTPKSTNSHFFCEERRSFLQPGVENRWLEQ